MTIDWNIQQFIAGNIYTGLLKKLGNNIEVDPKFRILII